MSYIADKDKCLDHLKRQPSHRHLIDVAILEKMTKNFFKDIDIYIPYISLCKKNNSTPDRERNKALAHIFVAHISSTIPNYTCGSCMGKMMDTIVAVYEKRTKRGFKKKL
jgi:hypothetical protein